MKKSNKGFTLIELLVVIAILGIVVTISGISINTATAANAKKAAAQTNAFISKCRTGCLSRSGETYIEISRDTTTNEIIGYYHDDSSDPTLSGEILGGSNVVCTYLYYGGSTTPSSLSDGSIKISFARDTGEELDDTAKGYKKYTEIILAGGGTSYTVNIAPSTGSHYVASGGN